MDSSTGYNPCYNMSTDMCGYMENNYRYNYNINDTYNLL